MRHFLLSLVLILGLAVPAAAQSNPTDPTPYVHYLQTQTIMGGDTACSGTAIGPYALLTASHCEEATSTIHVDGKRAKIVGTPIRDEYDHTIFLLQMAKPFAQYAPVRLTPAPKLGEPAYLIGNPGTIRSLFRSGQFAGVHTDEDSDKKAWMFNFFIAPGDSGAGVFDSNGLLYAVVSYIEDAGEPDEGIHMWVTMAFPLHFTQDQITQARSFTSTPLKADEEKKELPLMLLDFFLPNAPEPNE